MLASSHQFRSNATIRPLLLIPLLCLLPALTACASEPHPPTPAPLVHGAGHKVEGELSFLALGDSYTIGERVAPEKRWPVQLARMLRDRGLDVASPLILARTGWTTGDLLRALRAAELKGPFDLVTLQIGVNNQFQGRSVQQYRKQFKMLLERAIELAGGDPSNVLVLSIPDYSVTPFAQRMRRMSPHQIREEIERFNAVARQLTRQAGARFVNITPISRKAANNPSLLALDGLHPSGRMYRQWAKLALPKARAVLSQ